MVSRGDGFADFGEEAPYTHHKGPHHRKVEAEKPWSGKETNCNPLNNEIGKIPGNGDLYEEF